jgi:hypothetical protein
MPPLPKAGAQLELDTSAWDSAFKGAMADAGKLDALAPTVKVSVTDTDLKAAVDLAADLDKSTSLKVNVDDSELSAASDQLDNIATTGAIDLAINVAGNAKGFIEGLGRFSGLGGLMEMDGALALIQARTGKMIPDAEKLINDLYVNGWGSSKTEIAAVVAQAAQLGLEGADLEAAVLSTLQVVSVTGGDATETLNKLDGAAKANGRSFTETADLFIAGFQTGNDKADDLLDTLSEYGTTFSNFKLSAEGAMAFLDSGLNAGVFNSDVLADSVRELGIRLASIGTDENVTAAFDQLDSLSDIDLSKMLEGYEAGDILGDEMLQGIIDSLADVAAIDPALATTLGAAIVGTQLEDMGISVFTKLSTDADAAFGDIEGRAEDAGNAISDTLGVTVDTFLRNIEQMATSFLSSDAIDLDGKIETFKTQLQDAMAVAMSGGSLGEALEVGFGITGVDAALGNISRVFGQFTLTLLEILAFIQDPTSTTDADKLTRSQLAKGAAAQLPFDLQLANSEEIEGLLQQAVARGVTDLAAPITTALDEALAAGDFDQVAEILQGIMATTEMPPEAAQALVSDYIAKVNDAMEAAEPPAPPPPSWTAGFSGQNPLMPKIIDDSGLSKGAGGGAGAKGTNWWDTISVSPETIASLDAADEAVVTLDKDVDTAMTNAQLVTGLATDGMIAAFSAMSDGVVTADEEIALAITGNTMTSSFDAMSLSAAQNVEATKASFQGLLATVSSVDARMSAFFNGIMAKVGSVNSAIEGIGTVPTGGGGGSTTNNNIVVNQTNNVQGNAQATAAGYELATAVRGMA